MSIIKSYMLPHPPMIIPEIGEGREKQIKNWSRKKKDFLIDQMNPERKDLYQQIVE